MSKQVSNKKPIENLTNIDDAVDEVEETESEFECETCRDTGFVSEMGRVYPGEPHMADIDETPCPDCNLDEPDDYEPD